MTLLAKDIDRYVGHLAVDACRYQIVRRARLIEFQHQEIVTNSPDGVTVALDEYCDRELRKIDAL